MKDSDYIPRSVEKYAFDEDLTGRHMVILAGARQVGKTMLARHWLEKKSRKIVSRKESAFSKGGSHG
jgi:predicted AAA+ superfamily ATPase